MVTRKPKPSSCARAWVVTAVPPLWLTIDTAPGMKWSTSLISELNDAVRPMAVLITPMQFGPHSLRPVPRQTSSSSRCRARPSASVSANPPAQTTAAGTRAARQSRTTGTTDSAGTAMIAWSGTAGSAARLGKQRRPPTTSRPALTGQMAPRYPNFWRKPTASPPRLPSRSEAPMTATDRGARRGVRSPKELAAVVPPLRRGSRRIAYQPGRAA